MCVAYTLPVASGVRRVLLNRLFIAIGVLVILAIGAAFVVPRFVQWGDYRGRLETMAAEVFGAPVAIDGDIQLTLLPQPKIEFGKVRVGPEAAPSMEVGYVEAEFSLLDFLTDQYKVTRLQLERPVINLSVGSDGAVGSGLTLSGDAGQSNVSIADADVIDGTIRLADARSGASYAVEAIQGQLRLELLQGPFSFQGTASYQGAGYGVRVGTGTFSDAAASTLSVYVKPDDSSFTLESSGTLQTGDKPRFMGDITFRRPPPKPVEGETADIGRGDFVLNGKIDAASDRVLLSNYTVIPDENRSATRLTGAGELKLGKGMAFNAVVSGGVMALPPRDATTELADPPYELVRLLGETPLPPIPGIPGTIGLDVTEINLRAVSLRNVRLDAATDAKSWTITDFAATLPGGTDVGLTGNLSIVDGHPIFAGGVSLESQQLDQLAKLWRKPPDSNNPLFNMSGSLTADVALSSDTLTLSSGELVVAGINQQFDAEIGFGSQRHLNLQAHLTTLGETESAALGALLPDATDGGSFGTTFPKGTIDVSASKAVLFGLTGSDLAAAATWEGGVLEFSKLSAGDLGGASFDAKLTAFGTLTKPELSGVATLELDNGAPAMMQVLSALNTPPAIREFLGRSLPAKVSLQLDAPAGDGGQTLNVTGRLGTAETKLQARLTSGIVNALTAPIAASLDLRSESPQLMTAQLGLGETALFDDTSPLHLAVSVEGTPSNSYETNIAIDGGEDRIAFLGNVVTGDFTSMSGDGDIEVGLSDPSALVETLGAGGIYVPPLNGKAHLQFAGLDSLKLTRIEASGVTGDLTYARRGDLPSISGTLDLAALDLRGILPMLVGGSGAITGDGLWPNGPIDIGSAPRGSEGRIDVTAAEMTNGAEPFARDVAFGFDWTAQNVHLRNLSGTVGKGTLTVDATVCCSASTLPNKEISGRVSVAGVSVDAIAPPALGENLAGTLDATARFNGSGASLAEAMAAMTGTGSYTISDLSVAHFDPAVFSSAAALTNVLDMTPEALAERVSEQLATSPFEAPSATGSFTIAGGVLRSPNLAISNGDVRIFGGANLSLTDLQLDARYAMTPSDAPGGDSAVDVTTAEVAALIKGPLWAPEGSYDVSPLVDGMKIKANEIELSRLEQLRAEDEARQKAAAEERARIAAEQAAAEAAKKAADEAAAKKAADEAAAKQAADEAAQRRAAEQAAQTPQPLDLGL